MSKHDKFSFPVLIFFALFCFLITKSQDNPSSASPAAQNFHQWGAVTLFNGLPSDSVRAITQTPDGVLWFGTDNGLARFEGRRVETVSLENTETRKILALEVSPDGALWVGTQSGAFRYRGGKFRKITETQNHAVTAVLFGENIFLATENGVILRLDETSEDNFQIQTIPAAQPLTGNDGQPLKITSLAQTRGNTVAGTRSRSILLIENDRVLEISSRPRPFFVNALAKDARGKLWVAADSDRLGSGLFALEDMARAERIDTAGPGNILSIKPDEGGGVWVGTQNNGLFHFGGEGGEQLE